MSYTHKALDALKAMTAMIWRESGETWGLFIDGIIRGIVHSEDTMRRKWNSEKVNWRDN
jgi:hypothetical protein